MRWDTHISCYPFHYRWIRYYQSANAYLKPSPTIRRIGNGIYSVILFPSRSVSKLSCWQILIRGIRRDTDGKTNRYILELWNNGYLIWYFSIFFSLFSRNAYFRLVSKRKKVESESESQNPLLSPFWATFSLIIAKNSELLHRNIAGKKKKDSLWLWNYLSTSGFAKREIRDTEISVARICGATANRCGNTLWQMYTPSKSRINAEERAIGGCAWLIKAINRRLPSRCKQPIIPTVQS